MYATSRIALLALLASGLLACTDSLARFEEFNDRIPDAAPPVPEPDAEVLLNLPDVTGSYLLGMAAVISPDPPFRFIADVELHGNTIDLTLTGLHRFTAMPVPGEPLSALGVPVDATGAFEAAFDGIIPGDANVLTGSELTVEVVLVGRIRDEDTFCGDAIGEILKPIKLDIEGSTFSVLRIEPGMMGDDLPEPVAVCPE